MLPDTEVARELGNRIKRWTYGEGARASYKYFGQCEIATCRKEIVIDAKRRAGNWRCKTCSRMLGVIMGVSVNSPFIWKNRGRIVEWRRNKNGTCPVPYVYCAEKGCKTPVALHAVRYRKGPNIGNCAKHAHHWRKLRDFEGCFRDLRYRSRRRGIAFSLSYQQFVHICSVPCCHYCGRALERKGQGQKAAMIDRKDSNKGYSKENSVPCCWDCNNCKGASITYDEMLLIGLLRKGNASCAKKHFAALLKQQRESK